MKYLISLFLTLAFQGSALADAEINAGDKLFGVLDRTMQSKEIAESTTSAASQKYVNMFVMGSTNRPELHLKRSIIKIINTDHKNELRIEADKPVAEVVNDTANKFSYTENNEVIE